MFTVGTTINIIGGCIILSLILTVVSVFLPYWIIYSGNSSYNFGIVPFSADYAAWYQIVSIEMYISLSVLLILCLAYTVLWLKPNQSKNYYFFMIFLFSSVCNLELSALIISLAKGFVTEYGITQSLGVSAYLTGPSASAMLFAILFARIAFRQIHLGQVNNIC